MRKKLHMDCRGNIHVDGDGQMTAYHLSSVSEILILVDEDGVTTSIVCVVSVVLRAFTRMLVVVVVVVGVRQLMVIMVHGLIQMMCLY